MPAPDVSHSARYYLRRFWSYLNELSGVRPSHRMAGSHPSSMVRGPHSSFQPRTSFEEHGMHGRGARNSDTYKDHGGYGREGMHHPFNSSTHQQGGSNLGSNHNNGGTHTQSSLGPGILHAGGSHNGQNHHHHHAMMGPLSDHRHGDYLMGEGNFDDYETNHGEGEKHELCALGLTFLSMLLLVFTFPFSCFFCIKVVQEYERAVIFRLGRLVSGGERGPGIFFIIPCIDTYTKVDLRTVSFDVPPQEILSKDSVTVAVDAVVYFRISNAIASVSNVEDYARSTRLLAATTLRNVLGTKNLSEILSERESISHMIQTSLDEATDSWGVKVERVEIKDVRLPVQLQRAMAAEAEAAREARAKVIAAEGEQRASKALREASEVISDSPAALQLRYLQTLNSIAAEKNSTIVFPVPMELFRGIMPHNNNQNCGSSSSSSSSSTVSSPTAIHPKSSPPSPSSHSHSHHPHNPGHHHHSSHHSHGHHGHHPHHYHQTSNPTSNLVTNASILQPNALNSRNSSSIKQHSCFAQPETELDQQLIPNSSSTNNNSTSKGLMDSMNTTSTVVIRRQSRTKADRLYDMVSSGASHTAAALIGASIANIDANDVTNENFKSESRFQQGFPPPPLSNGSLQQASAPLSGGSNGQATNANNNRPIEMSSRYFLETECCNGPNRDNLHLNGSGEVGSSSLLNETDEHSFPNQINAYNSGHESDVEFGNCDISEYTE